jgi:hypothetical protein
LENVLLKSDASRALRVTPKVRALRLLLEERRQSRMLCCLLP